MGHAVAGSGVDAGKQFERCVTENEPFDLYGNKKVEIDKAVGEKIAHGGETAEYRTRGAERGGIDREVIFAPVLLLFDERGLVKLDKIGGHFRVEDRQVGDCRADPADHIKDEKPFRPPVIFEDGAKHPEGEHIVENVVPATVEKEIGDQLVRPEKGRTDVMQCEKVDHFMIEIRSERGLGEKYQNIDYNKILDYRRY